MDGAAGFGPGSHLQLIDGSGYIFRAYHALPPLTRKSDGLPVGAVAGFCNMVWKMLAELSGDEAPTHLAVVFDKSEHTFRNEMYPDYKAHRPPVPEDLVPQFGLIREATRAFGLPCLEMAGFEADDLIATYARLAREAGGRVTIVSADKDLMQLVAPGVEMYDTLKARRIGRDEVIEKFGVPPERVVDVQALAGDSVDNVPGAPGIGIKTAAALIAEYGDLDGLLARAGEVKQPKRRETLIAHAEQIRISRDLVTLRTDVEVEEPIESFGVRDPEAGRLMGFLAGMEFRTLAARVAQRLGVEAPTGGPAPRAARPAGTDAEAVTLDRTPRVGRAPGAPDLPPIARGGHAILRDAATLADWAARAIEAGVAAIAVETDGADEMRAGIVGIALCLGPGETAYAPVGHVTGAGDLFAATTRVEGQIGIDAAMAALAPMLEDPGVLKVGHDLKRAAKALARHGVRLGPVDDTQLIDYALHAGLHGHGLDGLSQEHLGYECIPLKSLIGGRGPKSLDAAAVEPVAEYAAEGAEVAWRLWRTLKPRLPFSKVTRVYETMERPLAPVLAEMEVAGVRVDRARLSRLSGDFAQKMAGLEDEIHALAGEKFNIGSPKQLGEVLFERLGFEGGKKGKTGAYGTGADVLEELASLGHELPARVLDWRLVSKLKSTYTDTLQAAINPETGRVHTSYSIAGAATGRLASTDPNLQNIPVRTDEGRRIREAFVAEAGNVLVSLDYSQIELRLLAHIADIAELREAFRQGLDIHAMTASEMFGVPIEGMDPMVRRQAKAINFGVIYGISAFGLAANLRIPRDDAKRFIDAYFERFPGIRAYMDRTRAFARAHGHVETVFGRRVHTPDINAKGPAAAFAYRAAINAPIQGSAADVIRRAMIRVPDAIRGLPARMLLQVHDELLFEVGESAVEETVARVRAVMEGAALPAVELSVPLVVDAGSGPSWAAAH
ncbi:DNA polymerase I [Amaricoccus sp.]|uniref:DNA polymerase I n=1 Tax=Amaricoccus sp. TaxID=1872485 RepID=UPI001B62BE13|nr:DNA polymerase I [Amaricoccus sp.]MBP7242276.1 DNA polymerase I [Amaricoccus sp.]